ncbi:ABC transporter ATP-binding protein [Massilia brevitalea]|uniref:ABC transporter ATP-binding protein n=1 Tax=Massilia brevitalea TaxID=442526 RepID=UPI0027399788|nr:ABC transporter ATP-binding protein [Massilia brevitalea]
MQTTQQIQQVDRAGQHGQPALGIANFNVSHGRIQVVFDVSLQVRAGEMLAVLGSNGAGKSSLLGGIAGVVNNQGSVTVNGVNLERLPAHLRSLKGISFVPERRGNIFSAMSVAENLDIGLRLTAADRQAAVKADILELFPILTKRMSAPAGMLSGGEQQMLAIGMALGREPSVLVLDEPSQGLAPTIFDLLQDTFDTLKKRNMAILLAEQNLPFATRIADRYIVLSQGEQVAEGEQSDLHDHSRIMALFMGPKG